MPSRQMHGDPEPGTDRRADDGLARSDRAVYQYMAGCGCKAIAACWSGGLQC